MSPLRVWIDHEQAPACKPGAHVKLSADESAHVVRSLRARRGDAVVLLDGEGLVVEGKLASADGDGAMVEVIRARTAEPLSPAIYVAQGMPKGGTMDDLVRTCCEAGAAGVIPLETTRCEVKLDADRARTRRERWQQQAVEACKQSGHPWRAEISAPVRFREWIERLPALVDGELRLTGSLEFDAEPVAHLDFTKASKVTWLIGPEGDFTPAEVHLARNGGCLPMTLGPIVLRTETAAIYSL
ncbi:MAG: 16S rRNA (uracil(1498)-N(3))-methyltransferase, partial [Opitutales bacterium]|nr:16S rRNA (uracil(1498)-N(3))-methyltransferase [Opitutales bacterium]